MIMAGRGKRLLLEKDEPKSVGTPLLPLDNSSTDLPSLIKKINEIIVSDIDPILLSNIQSIIKQLFKSKEIMKDILCNFHKKALDNADFGEKVVIALEQVSNLEIDGTLLRGELLAFIQNDFKVKEATFKSDTKIFVNSVIFLGHIYSRFKVCGAPIVILGVALFEYFDLLIKGQEEELKTLTKQILINGTKLKDNDKYDALMKTLRNTLVTKDLSPISRCWVLLAIDFMSNDLKPLNGAIRDFYIKNLGEEYKKLETMIPTQNNQSIISPPVSPICTKSQDTTSPKNKNANLNINKTPGFRKDLPKKFSDMSIKPNYENKGKVQLISSKSNKKDSWKSSGSVKGTSGHDDRFEKEENYYGTQKPRQPKPENQRKKLNDTESSRQEFDSFKTDFGKSSLLEPAKSKPENN